MEIKEMNKEDIFTNEQLKKKRDILRPNESLTDRTTSMLDYIINPGKVDTISVEDFKKQFE